MMPTIPNQAITHSGKFHADDVFSAALLRLVNPEIQFQRMARAPEAFDGILFDLGFGQYDHHQKDSPLRENGVPYAAFGLLWREFGTALVGEKDAQRFDERFVQPLDLDDNTGCGHPLAEIISVFNPVWDSEDDPDDAFGQAVAVASCILKREIAAIHGVQRARKLVEDAYFRQENGIVILPVFAPWKSVLIESDAQFVIYPSQRGGYSAQAIPVSKETTELKVAFPSKWAGKSPEELPALSGIPTLHFCHNNCFLVAADTVEDAVAACRAAQSLL